MNEQQLSTTAVFENYWKQVRDVLGLLPSKRRSFIKDENIALLKRDWKTFDGQQAVQRLFDSLASKGWQETPGANWVWREKHTEPSQQNDSQEVRLEHKIVDLGRQRWTRQISTASGVDAKWDQKDKKHKRTRSNRRRSIDLVYDQGEGGFSFVELKVGSDSPIYALFEILGYGLAYWHSRQEKPNHQPDASRLMQAQKIDLVVLGPTSWYQDTPHDMAALTEELNRGLAELTRGELPMRLCHTDYPLDDFKNAVPAADLAIAAITKLAPPTQRDTP
ncbi:MAG: hypothetical protein KA535_08615 [Azonexus sp.]|nr:hypothetical protein [Azonexus sp.]